MSRQRPPSINQVLRREKPPPKVVHGESPGWTLCRICGQGPVRALFAVEGRRFHQCLRCGSQLIDGPAFRPPRLEPKRVTFSARLTASRDRDRAIAQGALLAEQVPELHLYRVLDIGAGTGSFLAHVQDVFGCKGAGIEVNKTYVSYGGSQRRAIFQGDYRKLKVPRRSYTLVTFWDSLEYFIDPRRALRKAYHILKPGGVVAIGIRSGSSWDARANGRRWDGYHPLAGVQFYPSRTGLERLLEFTGFEEVVVRSVSRTDYCHPREKDLPGPDDDAGPLQRLEHALAPPMGRLLAALGLGTMLFATGRRPLSLERVPEPEDDFDDEDARQDSTPGAAGSGSRTPLAALPAVPAEPEEPPA